MGEEGSAQCDRDSGSTPHGGTEVLASQWLDSRQQEWVVFFPWGVEQPLGMGRLLLLSVFFLLLQLVQIEVTSSYQTIISEQEIPEERASEEEEPGEDFCSCLCDFPFPVTRLEFKPRVVTDQREEFSSTCSCTENNFNLDPKSQSCQPPPKPPGKKIDHRFHAFGDICPGKWLHLSSPAILPSEIMV